MSSSPSMVVSSNQKVGSASHVCSRIIPGLIKLAGPLGGLVGVVDADGGAPGPAPRASLPAPSTPSPSPLPLSPLGPAAPVSSCGDQSRGSCQRPYTCPLALSNLS